MKPMFSSCRQMKSNKKVEPQYHAFFHLVRGSDDSWNIVHLTIWAIHYALTVCVCNPLLTFLWSALPWPFLCYTLLLLVWSVGKELSGEGTTQKYQNGVANTNGQSILDCLNGQVNNVAQIVRRFLLHYCQDPSRWTMFQKSSEGLFFIIVRTHPAYSVTQSKKRQDALHSIL